MLAMQSLDPEHYTPLSGLCIFTAALKDLYAVKFPAMSRPSSSSAEQEEPETLLAENMADLQRFSELWPMGRGLLDVVGVMRKLYDRVLKDEGRRTSHSRESYAVLVQTINLAQDREIEVSELAAEATPADNACRDDLRDRSNYFEGDLTDISNVGPMSPGSFSAILDEDVWRDIVLFQDM